MELSFSDEQDFLREAVRGTVDRAASLPTVRGWVLEGEVDHASAHAIAVDQGWTGIGIPEEAGGQGGALLELVVLAEELGRAAVPADLLYSSLLAALALHRGGEAGELVGALAAGETTAALAVHGSRPLDGGGPSALVLGASAAEHLIAPEGAVHAAGDCTVTPRTLVDRTRAVADVGLGGEPSLTAKVELTELAGWAAVLVSADALGACQRMLELTVEYVGQRVQFGVPVGSFQAVKHAASEMVVAIEGARAALHYAAWAGGAEEPGWLTDAWVAKQRAARAAVLVADKALFLHGAVGYTWEHDLQLLFKRAKSDAALWGGASAYEDHIADTLGLVA